jgi:hypothetical protein
MRVATEVMVVGLHRVTTAIAWVLASGPQLRRRDIPTRAAAPMYGVALPAHLSLLRVLSVHPAL